MVTAWIAASTDRVKRISEAERGEVLAYMNEQGRPGEFVDDELIQATLTAHAASGVPQSLLVAPVTFFDSYRHSLRGLERLAATRNGADGWTTVQRKNNMKKKEKKEKEGGRRRGRRRRRRRRRRGSGWRALAHLRTRLPKVRRRPEHIGLKYLPMSRTRVNVINDTFKHDSDSCQSRSRIQKTACLTLERLAYRYTCQHTGLRWWST